VTIGTIKCEKTVLTGCGKANRIPQNAGFVGMKQH
jgi:hypothetical protein